MIAEITTAIFFALGAIGAIMAMKWKSRNSKPRMTDAELDKFYKRHDIEREWLFFFNKDYIDKNMKRNMERPEWEWLTGDGDDEEPWYVQHVRTEYSNKSILPVYHAMHAVADGSTSHWEPTTLAEKVITQPNTRKVESSDLLVQRTWRRPFVKETKNPFPYNPIPDRGDPLRKLRKNYKQTYRGWIKELHIASYK